MNKGVGMGREVETQVLTVRYPCFKCYPWCSFRPDLPIKEWLTLPGCQQENVIFHMPSTEILSLQPEVRNDLSQHLSSQMRYCSTCSYLSICFSNTVAELQFHNAVRARTKPSKGQALYWLSVILYI